MKYIARTVFGIIFILLVGCNLYILASSFKLESSINFYEREIAMYHQENVELEKKAYQVDSLNYSASEAARLSFVKEVEPMYLDKLQYALKK